ncbi:hypothetical protein GMO_16530 [Gluconobacter morbifer G707]|uniref:Gcp-like domain-containing protein n=1 Tax=Gluconobacter morbifer G707 TaxID=1088869 RepID=G6XJS4_9PROT|nr:hypothetical protein GMO_16530 [Gluconobacter morbifer G707]
MRAVVFNGAGAGTGATNLVALMQDGAVVAQEQLAGRGASEHFAPLTRRLLRQAGWQDAPDRVVAVTGPGSFTGLRSSLSLAAGLAEGWSCPTYGVTLGAALRATLGRPDVTCVSVARRGRLFVDPPAGPVVAVQTTDLDPAGWSAVAGDGVEEYSSWPCEALTCCAPTAAGIFQASLRECPAPLRPLYVDPPEARPPTGGLRSAPQ